MVNEPLRESKALAVRKVLKKLGQARVGDRVLVNGEMPKGQRAMDLKVLQCGSREESARDMPEGPIPVGLRGFKGILFGEIVEKDNDKECWFCVTYRLSGVELRSGSAEISAAQDTENAAIHGVFASAEFFDHTALAGIVSRRRVYMDPR